MLNLAFKVSDWLHRSFEAMQVAKVGTVPLGFIPSILFWDGSPQTTIMEPLFVNVSCSAAKSI